MIKNFLMTVLVISAVCAALYVEHAHSGELCTAGYRSLQVGGWSKHFISNKYGEGSWNETHHAIGLQCNEWSVTSFTNSHGKESYAVGYELVLTQRSNWRGSLYAGGWTGYSDMPHVGVVLPVITPAVTYNYRRLEAHVLVNPIVSVGYFGWRF